MKKPLLFLTSAVLFFSCTKTEIEEVEVIKEVETVKEVEKIVEVPTAVELKQVSIASGLTMTTESDEQTIVIAAAIESALEEETVIHLNFAGSAEMDADYTVSSTSITVPAGELTGSTEITIIADDVFESGAENIVISFAELPDTITPSDTSSSVQIDITDGSAVIGFSEASLTIDENSYYSLEVSLSKALNDEIVVYFEAETENVRYGLNGRDYIIIPAGNTTGSLSIDLNDSELTPDEKRAMTVTLVSVENEDVAISSNNVVGISTNEISEGLLINASWTTESDLFELRIYDSFDSRQESSANGGNTESIFIDKTSFFTLADGTYTIELESYNFEASSPAEDVTFTFVDDAGSTYDGPYTFTVNTPGDRIPVFTLEVAGGAYTVVQTSTSN